MKYRVHIRFPSVASVDSAVLMRMIADFHLQGFTFHVAEPQWYAQR